MKNKRLYSIVHGVISSTPIVRETAKSFYIDDNKTTLFYDHETIIPKTEACLTVDEVIRCRIKDLELKKERHANIIRGYENGINNANREIKKLKERLGNENQG